MQTTNTHLLLQLYHKLTGSAPTSIDKLPGAGSNRQYYRLHGSVSVIGVIGTSLDENEAFLYMARHFHAHGLPVPQILAESADHTAYLQEDLGHTALFDAIREGRTTGTFSATETALLTQAMHLLPQIQFIGAQGMDFSHCYPLPAFNRRSILWDLNYFKYCFLKTTPTDFQESKLEDDFERLADLLLQFSDTESFMYRDFQSRNVMVNASGLHFIDFQGGRKGPFYYDVASFLWQAKANLPASLRHRLANEYLQALQPYYPIDESTFFHNLRLFVLFRTLQVLGAYGFRGYFEKKAHFIESIPFALRNLDELLSSPFDELPYLCQVLQTMCNQMKTAAVTTAADSSATSPQTSSTAKAGKPASTTPQPAPMATATTEPQPQSKPRLTVSVWSFSYKKGLPADPSGNGGGYIFDCRSLPNPGRYERYKSLTGMDAPVIAFLEAETDIARWLTHVDALVNSHVERYLERGFTHLSIAFGCTGGQHRSVYCAQHVAMSLHEHYDVDIHLIHREQKVDRLILK